jgi:hypothetical protein
MGTELDRRIDELFLNEPRPAQHGSGEINEAASPLTHTPHLASLAVPQAASEVTHAVGSGSPSALSDDRLIHHLGAEASNALVERINSL